MGRPAGEKTTVVRLPMSEARKLRAIAKRLGITFREAWVRLSGKDLDRLYDRMKAGESIELGGES